MRILTISNCAALEHLGSGYIIKNFSKGLRTLNHAVDLLQPDDYEICKWMRPRANSYRQAFGMWWKGLRKFRTDEYDVIEFYGGEAWLATRWLSKSRNRRPLIVQHTNGPEPRYERMLNDFFGSKRRKWYQLDQGNLMREAFTRADLVVTVSEFDRDWVIAEGCQPPERVVAIENPIADVFLEPRDTLSKEKLIGYCGTWLPKKGIHVFSKDISRILTEFPEYRLLLIGVGPAFDRARYFPDAPTGRIEVIPHIQDKEELRRHYDRMEIFAFPSVIESFGLALAEAMARSCAVVTTKVGLGASLKDREEAMLLERAESPRLYEAVKELITNPELRMNLARNAARRVAHLRWSVAVKKLSDTYEEWVCRHRANANGNP